ncbi:DUF262 domain-containing HNH endonuclease family protein [Streptomyces phaeochromogenes]|uniref:DUF262 domain-containing protein n=1 Tax=Streptomyces phaeochromogenes TaxID=1923 RepID=UPI00386AF36D|nr:DUF262 domain-containing HNH endonuclease family protein [Streptomyces phaeochromogenes]
MASGHSGTSLQLNLLGIGEILRNNRLVVPQFQRSYCWKVDQEVQDYWTDLSRAIQTGAEEEYFLGTIVLTQDGPDDRKKIIDGQQRLVTSSLLIAAIRETLDELGHTQAHRIEADFLASQAWDAEDTEPHLKLNEDDHPPYHGIVTRTGLPLAPPKRAESDIFKAYRYFCKQLSELAGRHGESATNELKKWVKYIQHRAQLAVVETPSEADAYVIFETLNNRGADLTTADLLKNHLFGAAKLHLDSVRNNWHRSIGALSLSAADDKYTKFLRHYWSSKVGKVTERDLYARMRKEVVQSQDALGFSQDLLTGARIYAALSDPNHEIWQEKCPGRRPALSTLVLLNLVPNKILLLAAVEHLPANQIEKLLKALISWSVRGMVMGTINRGRYEDTYSQIAMGIRKGKITNISEIRTRVNDLIVSDTEFKAQFAFHTVGRTEANKIARYFLGALERTHQNEAEPEFIPNDNPTEVNLEHVYPQSAKANDWSDFIAVNDNQEDADKWIYRLGNMVLLQASVNSYIGNKPFKDKATVLAASQFALTKEVGDCPDWTPEAIQSRQERMANLAVRTWPR